MTTQHYSTTLKEEIEEPMEINEVLSNLIKSKGMSQMAFATELDFDRSLINKIIRKKIQPTTETMIRISKYLGMDSRAVFQCSKCCK